MTQDDDYGLRSRWLRLFGAVVLPLACVGVLVFLIPQVPSAWRGYQGAGQVGTLTVTAEQCGKGGCSYTGDFVSDNGSRRLGNVGVSGLYHHVGEEVRAYYTGNKDAVYVKGSSDLLFVGLGVFVAAMYVVGWLAWLTHKTRARLHR